VGGRCHIRYVSVRNTHLIKTALVVEAMSSGVGAPDSLAVIGLSEIRSTLPFRLGAAKH
jgi:hypothetical protein